VPEVDGLHVTELFMLQHSVVSTW